MRMVLLMNVITSATVNPCILLVQLDESFNQRAKADLIEIGYTPVIVPEAHQALLEIKKQQPAMIVIDRHRSKQAGFTLCRQLRKAQNRVLIIMVLEQESVEERVACLEAGVDDYILTAYHTENLLRLVHFYLTTAETVTERLQFDNLILDLNNRQLFINEIAIDLTMKEFELLKYLMSHPKEILTRDKILENVWGYDFQGESNVIEVYIRYLRLKIESKNQRRLIHTVRGVGYVLREG